MCINMKKVSSINLHRNASLTKEEILLLSVGLTSEKGHRLETWGWEVNARNILKMIQLLESAAGVQFFC